MNCDKITQPNLFICLKLNPQLKRLNLSKTSQLNSYAYRTLSFYCPNLQYLDLSQNSWINPQDLTLLSTLPRLKSIDLSSIPMDSIIDFLKSKPNIQSLGYRRTRILDHEESKQLVQLALRSIMSCDVESQKIGFDNLYFLREVNVSPHFEMIRSSGALSHMVQCLTHPVSLFPFSTFLSPLRIGSTEAFSPVACGSEFV
jgi:hypothetical protein